MSEQPLRLPDDLVLRLAKEIRELVVLGQPGASGTRSRALGPGLQGMERCLRVIVRFLRRVLAFPASCPRSPRSGRLPFFEAAALFGVSTVGWKGKEKWVPADYVLTVDRPPSKPRAERNGPIMHPVGLLFENGPQGQTPSQTHRR